jgi:hypothetical protein
MKSMLPSLMMKQPGSITANLRGQTSRSEAKILEA